MKIKNFLPDKLDLTGKSVLVTGGTGSFGQKFIETVLAHYQPARLIVYSRDELKQFEMAQKFPYEKFECMRYFIGDVRDRDRLTMAMRHVDYVIHAAAMKQVPAAEYNPMECLKTNVNGAENVVHAAMQNGVKKVIALSTDKAANPINLYGASKLASDKIFIAANNITGENGTRFAVVRYGNVMGSRGSVVPFFQKLIDEGAAALPITDPKMTRFWISLQQGVNLVLSSLEMMQGGEVFVPKIPSMKITALAQAMAPGMAQRVVGIRPGEKMHETMIPIDDGRNTIELEDRYIIEPSFAFWAINKERYKYARPTSADFCYSSDTNTEWLDENGLRELLGLPQIENANKKVA